MIVCENILLSLKYLVEFYDYITIVYRKLLSTHIFYRLHVMIDNVLNLH